MSYYEDERQTRRRQAREVSRRDDYDDDAYYNQRGQNRITTLVKRRDSYDDVDEEITRDISSPTGRGYVRETTIRRSGVRPARARSYDDDDRHYDDRYDDAPYAGTRRGESYRDEKRDRSRRRRRSSDYSSRSPSRDATKQRERRKSKVEETLESFGLGGLVGAVLGKEAKGRSSSRDRKRSQSRHGRDRALSETRSARHRSRSRGAHTREQVTQAIKAAILAGAGEAIRARKEPGGLTGEKGKRIITAAFSAGGVDTLVNYGKDPETHKFRDTLGSAVAGMATSRIVNGPRAPSRSPDRRGRSASRGGVRDLLAGGALAATAKKAYDNARSKSRGRSESRSRYSDTSRSPSRSKSRRRSLSRAAGRGLAAVGLSSAANKVDPDRDHDRRDTRRRYSDDYDDRSSYYDDHRDVGQPRDVNGRDRSRSQSHSDWHVDQPRGHDAGGYSLDYGPRKNGDPDTDSSSDLGSSTDEEKERKKGRKKLWLTSGLAGVATIHAAHGLYQSYEQRHVRKRAVKEGKISAEQAKKTLKKDRLNDAASIGIAAIGLKGAYSELKEMREHRTEYNEELEKMKRHREKREARRQKFEQMKKQGYVDSGYSSSMPNLHAPPPMYPPPGGWHQPFDDQSQYSGQAPYRQYGGGHDGNITPQYYDDNPYGGTFPHSSQNQIAAPPLPHPPVGTDHYPQQSRAPRERSPSRGRRL